MKPRKKTPPLNSPVLNLLAALVSGRLLPGDVPEDSWSDLTDAALNHGLAPMLFWQLKNKGMDSCPRENLETLTVSARQAAAADILYEESMRTITRGFSSAQIPAIWLKGADLARTVYPESVLRPMGDLDVLVSPGKLEAAVDVLKDLGYVFKTDITFRPDSPDKVDETYLKHLANHHYVLTGGSAGVVVVELHFGLPAHQHHNQLLPMDHMAWFWEHTRPFYSEEHTPFTGLATEAHLLYLAAHNIFQHGESQACLMRDLDLHLLITRQDPDWDIIIDQAVVLGWTRAVARSLERAVDYFATPVPDTVLESLARRRPAHEDATAAVKKTVPGFRWKIVQKKLSSLSVKEKIRYVFQNLFPVKSYMRKRYAVSPDRPVWPYYPYRWFDQGRDITRAIGKRMVRP